MATYSRYKNPEARRLYLAEYRKTNRKRINSRIRKLRRKFGRNKEQERSYYLKSTYGITIEQYNEMLVRQGGVCAICSRPPKSRRLAVDHCHITNIIRGLLCYVCNVKIVGLIEKRKIDAQRIADYLKMKRGDNYGSMQ